MTLSSAIILLLGITFLAALCFISRNKGLIEEICGHGYDWPYRWYRIKELFGVADWLETWPERYDKSYIEACSPILYPKLPNGEPAGVKYPNTDRNSMVFGMVGSTIFLVWLFFYLGWHI